MTTTAGRMRALRRASMLILSLVIGVTCLSAQEDGRELFIPEITTHSGAPLLLQLTIPDPEGTAISVAVETASSVTSYRVPADPERESIELSLSPFLGPGVYDLQIDMEVELEGETVQIVSPARIGFVDYVFGRDNLRFGNNADYESVIGTYGEILERWFTDRFGSVSDADLVLLVDYMYQFFGSRSGRCYAFSGSEVRYWLWPDLLPTYFDETYDFRVTASKTQWDMNYLQIDMAFDHFLADGYPLVRDPSENSDEAIYAAIVDEAWNIVSRVSGGEPVVAGFMGPSLHHAMVVYGFIHRPAAGTLDLLVANNWKSDQELNLSSRNAESIRVFLEREEEGPIVEWRYIDGKRNREIDRLFIVEAKYEFEHDPALLESLIASLRAAEARAGRAVLVVEEAKGAWLTDGSASSGYNRRTLDEIDGVLFDKVNRTYRFDYPADLDVTLELSDDVGARILHFYPGGDDEVETAWIQETPSPEEGSTLRRRVHLGTSAAIWEEVVEDE